MLLASDSFRERRKNRSKLVETLDADLRLPERHAGAVAFVKHPVRQLTAKVRPLIRVDARQILAVNGDTCRVRLNSGCHGYAIAAKRKLSLVVCGDRGRRTDDH
ncbi:hypothetical protein [Bradyrhizobium sp. 195]|uniref:hypothetical protein n=1 Tax=Bradyrhizobium sp. 195 TaxID=2782662 RepID=UPI002001660E|nr:hypothetical protein [Bradyrhizobium sp. 195]